MFRLLSALTRAQKSYIFLAIDLMFLPAALLAALALQMPARSVWPLFFEALPVLPYILLLVALAARKLGLPQVQLNAYERHAVGLTVLVALVATTALVVALGIFGPQVALGTFVVFALIYFIAMVAVRAWLLQVVNAIYRRAEPRCRVLIYGAGATGTQLAQALRSHNWIDPVAFVDDNKSLQGMALVGMPVYAPARIEELVKSRQISRVLLAMPSQSQPKQAKIIQRLQALKLDVQALPSFAQLVGTEALVEKLTPVAPKNFLGRRAHDVPLSADAYRGKVVLVSGAGGSIGSELCRQVLACRPQKLVLYELSELALYTIHQELCAQAQAQGIELVPVLGSVTDPRQVREVLRCHQIEVVLHAAAYKHVPLVEANPLAGLANNVFGTRTLARAAGDFGVERFILISSDKAVRPTNVMGASKRMAELVLQDLASRSTSTVYTMVRFGNVLGSSGSVVPLFQEQVARGGPVTVTDPNVRRFFMTIQEAVQLVLTAGADAKGGEVFVLDMGKPVPIIQLARQVIESAGYSVRDEDHPEGDISIDIIGLRPGEKMEEELTLTDDLMLTPHPKIFCAHEAVISEIEVAAFVRALRQVVAANDEAGARALIGRWVEGDGIDLGRSAHS
ncbi:NAD-dependent epimerase/dehydratase family protein [Epibacterium sp. SM1969]|uniref:NAD-dependent epimerase/dehydratase family protein n=1 Tax=Tritonibacter aquimaris TaxID=2663379 RepID=A0A844ASR1_9RHOB|nr:nucleoside-diphosphate sugar epimerase/dehydratase [Tritonibacter aquimaris]MQY44143.1 NAD-dependent epimerase/dehydratase family protein [Tritonibacter aquimaris]